MSSLNMSTGTKIGYILMGIISCIAGVWMFMYPVSTESTLGLVIGCMLIGYGLVAIISFFASELYRSVFRFNLIFGLLAIVFGIVVLGNIYSSMNFMGVLAGIILLVDGCMRVYLSFEMKKMGVSAWWAVLIFAILTVIVGGIFLFNPSASGVLLTMLTGAMFLSQGFLDLSVGIFGI